MKGIVHWMQMVEKCTVKYWKYFLEYVFRVVALPSLRAFKKSTAGGVLLAQGAFIHWVYVAWWCQISWLAVWSGRCHLGVFFRYICIKPIFTAAQSHSSVWSEVTVFIRDRFSSLSIQRYAPHGGTYYILHYLLDGPIIPAYQCTVFLTTYYIHGWYSERIKIPV
jgi:hypothetical protein